MAPRRVKVNKFDSKSLSANDVICPICRSILIKPITLPCSHGFCESCFETTQNANICPLCRVRVGSWLRSATKSKKLINETLWKAIQDLFPSQVRNKLNEKHQEKGKLKEKGESENCNLVQVSKKLTSDQPINNSRFSMRRGDDKLNRQVSSEASTSANAVSKKNTFRNAIPKNSDKIMSVDIEKKEKRPNIFMKNFATKEYTCRILCQNISSKDAQKSIFKESQPIIQRKHKRIQEITESEMLNDRSNSIESECLYFKPIDYRHNPPSEGLTPIKVPTRKPNVNSNIKILAPSGQNQINLNHLESAFARLCSPVPSMDKETVHKKENIDSQIQEGTSLISAKRKYDRSDNKTVKKIKTNHRTTENQSLLLLKKDMCVTSKCKNSTSDSIPNSNDKPLVNGLTSEEYIKRSMQEKADFELATKLQQTFNQSLKYSTRSAVLKMMGAKNQVKLESIMAPYKVK